MLDETLIHHRRTVPRSETLVALAAVGDGVNGVGRLGGRESGGRRAAIEE
jgi:hypothetical protein